MVHRLPRVGGNVTPYMLAYDFNITAYRGNRWITFFS